MKKIMLLLALTFATVGGVATVMTVYPQQAVAACEGSGCD
jgi:hypothetical protein